MGLALAITGCASTSPPARFYVLTPLATAPAVAAQNAWIIGVGPIRLPGYLERDQIVGRAGSNNLQVDEFDRWGGALDRNIADVLAENLSRLLGTDGVVSYPWSSAVRIDYQVALDIRGMERADDGQVHLVAQWRLFQGDGEELLKIRRAEIAEPVAGEGYNAQAAAQSRALAALSQEVARSIQALPKT